MKRLIVDGYNVINSDPVYRQLAAEDVDSARARLVEDVAAFCHGGVRGTVVFDGGGNPHSDGTPHHVAGVTVVFSPSGTTADSVVESFVLRGRRRGESLTVVTSDRGTQEAVTGRGVIRMSAREFAAELRAEGVEWREHTPAGAHHGRLEELVDNATREALFRWARDDRRR